MRLKIHTYQLILIILLNAFPMLLQAVQQDDMKAAWQIRQQVRLRVHLLLDADSLVQSQTDSLLYKQIPLAFLVSGEISEKLQILIGQIPSQNLPVVLIQKAGRPIHSKVSDRTLVLTDTDLDSLLITAMPEETLSNLSCREFLRIRIETDSLPSIGYFARLWQRTGKMPNFIQPRRGRAVEAVNIVVSINRTPKIFGVVRNGTQLLPEVSWKDFPNRKTNGYFCFPIGSGTALAPYKAGYQFSPDIILPSPENLGNIKIFNAVPLDPDFGLTDQFTFSKEVLNLKQDNPVEIIQNGIGFVKDKTRGNCAYFNGKAYVDGGLMSRGALKANFSITAWIKPVKLTENNCILGKGKDFVLKIRKGLLTFTVQGIKDYFSTQTIIPTDKWSFVGLVHNGPENQISFYLNGELTETIKLRTPYAESDYTMLIGSNLWEEYFEGYMSQIKIWNRELNGDEIKNDYLFGNKAKKPILTSWFLGLFVILGLGGFYLRRRFVGTNRIETDRKRKLDSAPKERALPISETNDYAEQICCFGGLKVIGSDRKDVSKKFSPKIKQLFVLILLNSIGGRKGISSKDLSDCLWPGMSLQNAKNIRGTNIQNLKALLASCTGIKLAFHEKLWMLEFADGYFIDYAVVELWLSEPENLDLAELARRLPELLSILKKGALFPDMSESWIDPYIDRMSNRIIEYGLCLFRQLPEVKYDMLLLEIADTISINDPLNEPALRKKINILTRQGKLSLAHTVFDNFTKLYFELYQEKYPGDFKFLIANIKSEDEIHPDL